MKIQEEREEKVKTLVAKITAGHEEKIPELWAELENLCAWYCRKLYRQLPDSFLLDFEDLSQCGYIALLDALRHYDNDRAGRFSVLYLFYLNGAIYRENRLNTGGHHVDGSRRFDPAIAKGSFRLDAETDESGEKGGTLLDALAADDFPENGMDTIAGVTEQIFRQQLHSALEELIQDLPAAERHLIRQKYYAQRDRLSIARELHISSHDAVMLEDRALIDLRTRGKAVGLEQFLDGRIDYYSGTGLQGFKETGTSSTERLAIKRLDLEARYNKLFKSEI